MIQRKKSAQTIAITLLMRREQNAMSGLDAANERIDIDGGKTGSCHGLYALYRA